MKHHRVARVAEVIREVASETILFKISDPRVRNVTVTRVEVSADLQHAKVHVSVMGTPARQKKALAGLQSAAGFVQAQLGDRMRTRYTPTLRFLLDNGIKQSVEISRLINEALGKAPDAADAELSDQDEDDDEDEVEEGEEDEAGDGAPEGDSRSPGH
ncbi:MAG: 30S ribosome-binding factor RbfA [Planctomycetes bacterium]|nr:30S ribosome-binding factor RbfA [Planctomycetota bacterium]